MLLKLAGHDRDWTVRSLEADLGIPRAGVHRSLGRLRSAGLYDLDRRRTNLSQAEEFLVHAVKYLFPPEFSGEARGIPTAWAAQPLSDELAPQSDLPPSGPIPTATSAASRSPHCTPPSRRSPAMTRSSGSDWR